MTRIQRDSEVIKTILFGENFEEVLQALPPEVGMNFDLVIKESLHKYYSDVGVEYYDEVEESPNVVLKKLGKIVLERIDKSKAVPIVAKIVKDIGMSLHENLSIKDIDLVAEAYMIELSLGELFGSKDYAQPIVKEYVRFLLKDVIPVEKKLQV